jgi:8-oxo-dGTP diphosphatase
MGILSALGFAWKPHEETTYRYRKWHRWKNLVWHQPMTQGQDTWPEGTRSQNISRIYVIIDEKPYAGTFRVSSGVCSLGIVSHKHVQELFKTDASNIQFLKKDKGVSTAHPRFGETTNLTHRYDYIAKVIDSSKLVKGKPPGQIVRRRGTAIIDTPKGILVVAGRKELYILPGGGAEHNESREEAVAREVMEETGLKVVSSKYLFEHNDAPERRIQNLHKVFLLGVAGRVKPDGHEVRHIGYWKPGSDVPISNTTKLLIQKYIDEFKTK